jgi:hypothetical protein
MNMTHNERQHWIGEIARINNRINSAGREGDADERRA